MAYLVVAYPELSPSNFNWIQTYRKQHDLLYYDLIEPHFTIVFPVFDVEEALFLSEVKTRSKGYQAFDFVLRSATINKDAFNNYYHTFLVPDKGNSAIIKLHDGLYSQKLKENLRLDVDFIPHIGIGNSLDPLECKNLIDHLNKQDIQIRGSVTKLTVIAFENDKIRPIAEFSLQRK